MAEEKRGANYDPDEAELPLRRDGLVRKMKGGEEAAKVAEEVSAAGAVEESETG